MDRRPISGTDDDDDDDGMMMQVSSSFWISSERQSSPPEVVGVRILPWIPTATKVVLQPLTSNDAELWHVHATWLEQDGWLHQVSVVFVHQVVELTVPQSSTTTTTNTICRARVLHIETTTTTLAQEEEHDPQDPIHGDRNNNNDQDIAPEERLWSVPAWEVEWPTPEEHEQDGMANGRRDNHHSNNKPSNHTTTPITTNNPNYARLVANVRMVLVDPPDDPQESSSSSLSSSMIRLSPCPTLQDYAPSCRAMLPHESSPPPWVPTSCTVLVHPRVFEQLAVRGHWNDRPQEECSTMGDPADENATRPAQDSLLFSGLVRIQRVHSKTDHRNNKSSSTSTTTTTTQSLQRQETVVATAAPSPLVQSMIVRVSSCNTVPSPQSIGKKNANVFVCFAMTCHVVRSFSEMIQYHANTEDVYASYFVDHVYSTSN